MRKRAVMDEVASGESPNSSPEWSYAIEGAGEGRRRLFGGRSFRRGGLEGSSGAVHRTTEEGSMARMTLYDRLFPGPGSGAPKCCCSAGNAAPVFPVPGSEIEARFRGYKITDPTVSK